MGSNKILKLTATGPRFGSSDRWRVFALLGRCCRRRDAISRRWQVVPAAAVHRQALPVCPRPQSSPSASSSGRGWPPSSSRFGTRCVCLPFSPPSVATFLRSLVAAAASSRHVFTAVGKKLSIAATIKKASTQRPPHARPNAYKLSIKPSSNRTSSYVKYRNTCGTKIITKGLSCDLLTNCRTINEGNPAQVTR